MNTQCSITVLLPGSRVNRSVRYRHRERSRDEETSRRRPKVNEGWVSAAAFDRFLNWLGPNPEAAAQKYELIRSRLIMMFRARRCVFAEDLADATFERVARKLTQLTVEFNGDPARYFYGVAKKIYLEYQREIRAVPYPAESSLNKNTDDKANACDQELENMLEQLDEALNTIPKSDRELILKYYTGNGQQKIAHRRALAEQFGIRPNTLRLRVFRIRKEIKASMFRSELARSVKPTRSHR